MSAVIEELFGYAYNDTPVLYSAKALLVWLGVEALRSTAKRITMYLINIIKWPIVPLISVANTT